MSGVPKQSLCVVRVAGVEPAFQPWEGHILPLYYTRLEPLGGIEPPTYVYHPTK